MPCYYHPEREPIASCTECGRLVCSECSTVEGDKTFCSRCYDRGPSTFRETSQVRYRKSPLLAVLLSVIPGLGQLYNEQLLKGILIMLVFFFVLVTFVGGGFQLWDNMMGPSFWSRTFSGSHYFDLRPHMTVGFHGSYESLYLSLFIILIYCYAIFDAATTATKINRGEIVLHPRRAIRNGSVRARTSDKELRREARTVMDQTQPAMEQPASVKARPSRAETRRSMREQGRSRNVAILGWILIIVGLLIWGEIANIPFLELENIWPLFPLILGVRFLYDYRRYDEPSQLLLGLVFTLIGGYFLLEGTPIGDFFEETIEQAVGLWPLLLIIAGAYLIWTSRSKRKEENTTTKTEKNDELQNPS